MNKKKTGKKVAALVVALVLLVQMVPSFFASEVIPEEGIESEVAYALGISESDFPESTLRPRSLTRDIDKISKTPRDIVLVLDTSGSMAGTPVIELRKAVEVFAQDIMSKTSDTRVAIINFNEEAHLLQEFTKDEADLIAASRQLNAGGYTNMQAGIEKAEALFANEDYSGVGSGGSGRPRSTKKMIMILSDGQPNNGYFYTQPDARYKADDYPGVSPNDAPAASYVYNHVKNTSFKDQDYYVYTLGFFHSLKTEPGPLKLCTDLLKDIQNKGFYEVLNAEDLQIAFDDMIEAMVNDSPIIVIPDIMASNLYSNSGLTNQVWPSTNLANANTELNIANTLYVANPTDLVPVAPGSREYGANGIYKNLIDSIATKYPGRKLFFFAYDFRQSYASNAAKLEAFINTMGLSQYETVDLVAHGAGSYVASHYIQRDPQNEGNVNLFITLGAPFEGVPAVVHGAINNNAPADAVANPDMDPVEALKGLPKELKTSWPGLAEITPTQRYVTKTPFFAQGAWNSSTNQFDTVQIDYNAYKGYANSIFGSTRYAAAITQQNLIGNLTNGPIIKNFPRAYVVLSTAGNTTPTSLVFDRTGVNDVEVVDMEIGSGDGVVPLNSLNSYNTLKDALTGTRVQTFATYNHAEIAGTNATKTLSVLWVNNLLNKFEAPTPPPINPNTGRPYIVIRVACPVDVEIKLGGETLNNTTSTETSFGKAFVMGENDDIKVIVVENASDDPQDIIYDLSLQGTGTGTMDYSIRFADENGNIELQRTFKAVPITSQTTITTDTQKGDDTVLNVDENGNKTKLSHKELSKAPQPPVDPPVTPPVDPPVTPPVDPPVTPPVEPPVTPPVTPPTSSGGGRSSGGSSGGSNMRDGAAVTAPQGKVRIFTANDAKKLFNKALAKNGNNSTLVVRAINYDIADAAGLKEIQKLAAQSNVQANVYFDTVVKNKVTFRLKVNPAQINTTIAVGPSVKAERVKQNFAKQFRNAVQIIDVEQKATLLKQAEVAVLLDKNIAKENLVFYRYDATRKSYQRMENVQYVVDSNGFVHFVADLSTTIVISNGTLAK